MSAAVPAGLGTVRQWLVEWTVSGAALAGGVPLIALVAIAAVERPTTGRALVEVLLSIVCVGGAAGALIGGLGAWPVHRASRWLWARVHPMAALLLGPLLGGLGGAALGALLMAGPLHETSARSLTAAALGGSTCAGLTIAPAWVVYLALHARGRPGWAALAVAAVWAPFPLAATFATLLLVA